MKRPCKMHPNFFFFEILVGLHKFNKACVLALHHGNGAVISAAASQVSALVEFYMFSPPGCLVYSHLQLGYLHFYTVPCDGLDDFIFEIFTPYIQ